MLVRYSREGIAIKIYKKKGTGVCMKVSVIIPTYNREKTIKRAINSVLNQDYKDIEVIVVDDCSTDNTSNIVENIKDDRLRYIKLKKRDGACKARNVGIENATGKYIAFQDSDDVWKEDKLSVQLETLKLNKADIAVCNYLQINTRTGKRKQCITHCLDGFIQYETLLKQNIASTQCMFIKSECLEKIRFDENLKKVQDWDLILNLVRQYKVYFQNEMLVDVYLQEDSITRHKEYNLESFLTIYNKHKETILENNNLNSIWNRRIGRAKLAQGIVSSKEFKKAFLLKPNLKDLCYFVMAKLGIILVARKIRYFIFKE